MNADDPNYNVLPMPLPGKTLLKQELQKRVAKMGLEPLDSRKVLVSYDPDPKGPRASPICIKVGEYDFECFRRSDDVWIFARTIGHRDAKRYNLGEFLAVGGAPEALQTALTMALKFQPKHKIRLP